MSEVVSFRSYRMPNAAFEQVVEEAGDVLQTGGRPDLKSWGIGLGGDAAAEIGGQLMMFSWHPDREALIEALRTYLLYSAMPPVGYDLAAAQTRIDASLDSYAAHGDAQQLTTDLRDALRTHIRVDWAGSIEELSSGDTPFALNIRSAFLEAEEDIVRSLDEAEIDDFIDFLDGWMAGS